MADDKITLQIELDDGSVKTAFATIEREGKRTGEKLEKNFQSGIFKELKGGLDDVVARVPGMQGLARAIGMIPAPLIAATAAIVAMKEAAEFAFEQTLAGEKVKAVGESFRIISQNAGLAGDDLLKAFEDKSQGLIQTDEIAQQLTKSIVAMGAEAKNLGPVFDIAIKLSQSMGGSVKDNFELLSNSIANLTTRQLKSVGLGIDAAAVFERYALTLNKSSSELTMAEKQHALLNSVVEKGKTSLGGIDTSVMQATNAFIGFKNAVEDTAQVMQVKIANQFGPSFAGVFHILTSAVKAFGDESEVTGSKVKLMADISVESAIKKMKEFQQQQAAVAAENAANAAPPAKAQDMAAQQLALAQANEQAAQLQMQRTQDEAMQETLRGQQIISILEQTELQKQQLRLQFQEQHINDETLFQERLAAITQAGELKIAGIKTTAMQAQESSRKSIQQNANNTIANGTAQFVASTMKSLAAGKAGWEQFGKGVLGVVGDMAIQIGMFGLAQGILMQALGSNPFTAGAVSIVGALALIAVGTMLKSMAGGEGGMGAGAGGGGGVSAPTAPTTQIQEPEQIKPSTNINVNIAGNVLDRRQTGLEIAEIIAESFDSNGTRIIGGALA